MTGPASMVQKGLLYLFDCTQRSMGNTKLCSIRSPDSFCVSFCVQKVSGDLHYLLAKRLVNIFMALFLDNCLSIRKLLFPRSVFSLLCITLKVLNKVTFLQNKGAVGYNKESTLRVMQSKEKTLLRKKSFLADRHLSRKRAIKMLTGLLVRR